MKKKANLKLRDVRPAKDPKGGRGGRRTGGGRGRDDSGTGGRSGPPRRFLP